MSVPARSSVLILGGHAAFHLGGLGARGDEEAEVGSAGQKYENRELERMLEGS